MTWKEAAHDGGDSGMSGLPKLDRNSNATVQNTTLGIWLMVATTVVFAVQDGISRHLASEYNVFMVVMIRFWFFAAFVMALAARDAARQGQGLRAAVRSRFPW